MSLSMVIHGESGAGKSRLSWTMPGKKLILDAEGRSRFYEGPRVVWNPLTEQPPADDGTWDLCTVWAKNYAVVSMVQQWLLSGQHPFDSFAVDSQTQLQKRCIEFVAGAEQPSERQWGEILRHLEGFTTSLHDLTYLGPKPLSCVVVTTLTHMRDGWYRPYVKGQLELTLPALLDSVGFLWVAAGADGADERHLLLHNSPPYLAKDNTGALPAHVVNPNLADLVRLTEGEAA